jgi:hypothetical protein
MKSDDGSVTARCDGLLRAAGLVEVVALPAAANQTATPQSSKTGDRSGRR